MKPSETVKTATQGKDLIVFDGVCVFCNAWVKFVLRFDKAARYSFVIAQSELGEMLYAELGLKSDDYDTFIVVTDDNITTSLDGVLTVCGKLGLPWSALRVFQVLPKWLKDFTYNSVARNRYKIFGRRDTCMMPTPDIKGRFLG